MSTTSTAKHQRLADVSRDKFAESNDCAVIAVAILADLDYAVAWSALAEEGRRRRDGATHAQTAAALRRAVGPAKCSLAGVDGDVTAAQYAGRNAGRYLLFTDGHVVAAEGGIVHDGAARRSKVIAAIKVED